MSTCPTCGRYFANHVSLLQHSENSRCAGASNVHRGISLWERSRQQQRFTSSRGARYDTLIADEDSYDHDRGEYVCGICDRGWPRLNSLRQHLASGAHDGANYECRGCGRTFSRAAQLTQHHRSSSSCGDVDERLGRLLVRHYSEMGTLRLTNGASRHEATLRFDGSAKPNPGRGGAGYVLSDHDGRVVETGCVRIGSARCTNNMAEYVGLIQGLKSARRQGIRGTLRVQGDSQLVVNQLKGIFEVRSAKLESPRRRPTTGARCRSARNADRVRSQVSSTVGPSTTRRARSSGNSPTTPSPTSAATRTRRPTRSPTRPSIPRAARTNTSTSLTSTTKYPAIWINRRCAVVKPVGSGARRLFGSA